MNDTDSQDQYLSELTLDAVRQEAYEEVARACAKVGVVLGTQFEGRAVATRQKTDPFDQSKTIEMVWGDSDATLLVREDGRVYGECFILQAHPMNDRYLVEAVELWGAPGALSSELRIVPLGDVD